MKKLLVVIGIGLSSTCFADFQGTIGYGNSTSLSFQYNFEAWYPKLTAEYDKTLSAGIGGYFEFVQSDLDIGFDWDKNKPFLETNTIVLPKIKSGNGNFGCGIGLSKRWYYTKHTLYDTPVYPKMILSFDF